MFIIITNNGQRIAVSANELGKTDFTQVYDVELVDGCNMLDAYKFLNYGVRQAQDAIIASKGKSKQAQACWDVLAPLAQAISYELARSK